VRDRADEARAHLAGVPDGPAREALDAFAELIATRTA
jgi:geranylgeranyl pyrophosphate synthase